MASAAGALAFAGGAAAAPELPSNGFQANGGFTHVDGSGPQNDSRQRLLDARTRRLSSASIASSDVGDVAVVVDNGRIFQQPRPTRPFDLVEPSSLNFERSGGDAFAASLDGPAFDPVTGGALPLDDDDTEEVTLPFAFPFLGGSYTSVFVNSDGNLTFGTGDTETTERDAARLIGGPPRIAPWLNDLNPAAGGAVSASVRPSSLVVTWAEVPEFGATNANTFQVTLDSAGTITFAYEQMDASFGVVGLAEGGDEGPLSELDLSQNLPGTFPAGAIFEEFEPAILLKRLNVFEAAREFYKTHPDKFDQLVFFTDSDVDLGDGTFAFATVTKNTTQGLGLTVGDFSSERGLPPELEALVAMNDIGLYWSDAKKMLNPPIKKFRFGAQIAFEPPGSEQLSRRARWFGTIDGVGAFTLGLNSAMSIMGQESGHRWLAFPRFRHPTSPDPFDDFDLLGRGFSHWSFFFNTRVPDAQFGGDPRTSSMEGNALIDTGSSSCVAPGQTLFQTEANELIDGYTELDQYMMGLRTEDQVPSFWYVDNPTFRFNGESAEAVREVDALDDASFCGNRVDLTIDDIQAAEGPRVPAVGDEVDTDAGGAPRLDVKTQAFVLLIDSDSPKASAHAGAISVIDTFRKTWQSYVNGPATGGRGRFDTRLSPDIF